MPDNRISVRAFRQLFRLVAVGPEHRVVNGIDAVNGSKRRGSYHLLRAGDLRNQPLEPAGRSPGKSQNRAPALTRWSFVTLKRTRLV